jgi:hypothetical protein
MPLPSHYPNYTSWSVQAMKLLLTRVLCTRAYCCGNTGLWMLVLTCVSEAARFTRMLVLVTRWMFDSSVNRLFPATTYQWIGSDFLQHKFHMSYRQRFPSATIRFHKLCKKVKGNRFKLLIECRSSLRISLHIVNAITTQKHSTPPVNEEPYIFWKIHNKFWEPW